MKTIREKLHDSAATFAGFFRKEFIQIFRDRKMIAVLFFIPVMQLVMFGLALTSEVKNIKLAIIGKPSPIAREIERRALESGWFKSAGIFQNDIGSPAELIISGKAEAALILPYEGLNRNFQGLAAAGSGPAGQASAKQKAANSISFFYESGKMAQNGKPAQLLINAINAQRAQQISAYVSQILARIAAEKGMPQSAMKIENRIMFNHYLETKNFMVPALAAMGSYLVILLVCAMSITKEKETGTMEKLIAAPISVIEILAGKTLPYFIIGLVIIGLMLAAGTAGFGLPLRGRIWQLSVNAIALDACALSIATLISTIAKSQQQAMMGCILVLLPSILLSGVLFPVSNIPDAFRWICYLNPLMYGAANFRNIILKGGDPASFWLNFAITSSLALLLMGWAWKNFKAKLN